MPVKKITPQFRNLVFEGGGMRGIAYVGAMRVLEQRDALAHVVRTGGTSAGAINALVYSLGYTVPEQRDILASTDFEKFMDDSFGVIRDIRRLAKHFGYFKGDFFSTWIADLINDKLNSRKATFADLKAAGGADLYMVGTNLSTGFAEVFSHERHADMPLAEAIRISMSIPLFFAAVRHGDRDDVYVDGGVVRNYPIKLFDRERYIDMKKEADAARKTSYYNRENALFSLEMPGRSPYVFNRQTLGMRLDTREEIALFRYDEPAAGEEIERFTEYAKALMGAILSVQENQHLHSDDWQRSVYIDTLDVSTTDFSLSEIKKMQLIQSGIDCAEKYFEWFEDPSEAVVTRIAAPAPGAIAVVA